jgi:hypothetical protein
MCRSTIIAQMSEPFPEEPLGESANVKAADQESSAYLPTLPAKSPITIERFADGLTIQVPPAGLWGGTKGLFFFALVWNGFMAIFTPLMIAGFLAGNDAKQDGSIWIAILFLSVFWLVGVGLLLGSLNMARRGAALAVTGGTLMVLQTGLFGSKQRDWPPGDLEAVRAGPSGMTVNDVPVLELQIFDGGGNKFGLLAGRSDEELEWLAYELRQALGASEQL